MADKQDLIIQRLDTLIEQFREVKNTVYGHDGVPGLKIDVDRLKQKEKARQWNIRALWTGFVSVVLKFVYDGFA